MGTPTLLPLAAETPSAGGAETLQILIATGGALVVTTALLVLGIGHRTGRIAALGRLATFSERVSGLPGWAALPLGVAIPTLLAALFGLSWDESLHIDDGRDDGPLANPSHYFILVGLFGIFAAGWLAIVLPEKGSRPGPAPLRVGRGWHAPVGGAVVVACSAVALAGFPLDDVSHRLFGQDVSLWGTTHLQMLTGVATGVVGLVILFREGLLEARARAEAGRAIETFPLPGGAKRLRHVAYYSTLGGGLLAALSIYLGEFDFGVPQFRLVYHPILVAGIAAFALVTVRALAGPGTALLAALWFCAIRGVITLLVGPVLGEATATFPLFLAEALLVEAAALALAARARPVAFAAASGALIGTVGVLAEYGWTQAWSPIPWPAHLLPEAIALSVPVAIAAALLGAFLFGGLERRRDLAATRPAIATAAASVLVIAAVLTALTRSETPDVRASVTLEEVRPAPEREVVATVRIDPPDAARDADWFHTIAYQGEEPLRIDELDAVAPGVYRTAPIPVHGTWKSAVRIHRGSEMVAMPVFLPADEAIPAAEVPAPASFTRGFIGDREILQRERKDDVAEWIVTAFSALVLAICLGLVAILGAALVRLASTPHDGERPAGRARPGRPSARRRVAAGTAAPE